MATKKKTSPETEAVAKAAAAPVEKKKPTSAKSPAAMHKTATRKTPVQNSEPAATAVAPQAAKAPVTAAGFDAAAHHDEISREAYFLFLNRGANHGHEQEDWLRAIEIVKARY